MQPDPNVVQTLPFFFFSVRPSRIPQGQAGFRQAESTGLGHTIRVGVDKRLRDGGSHLDEVCGGKGRVLIWQKVMLCPRRRDHGELCLGIFPPRSHGIYRVSFLGNTQYPMPNAR